MTGLSRLALAAAFALAGAGGARAQLSPDHLASRAPSKDPRNIAGAYQRGDNSGTTLLPDGGGLPPFTPWAKAIYDRRIAAAKRGEPEADASTACLPHGTPRVLFGSFPIYIYQFGKTGSASGAEEVVFSHEIQHLVRHIYLNEQHPPELDPSYLGHHVGRWDGDTLVIDTVGQNTETWLDGSGIPHSDKLHMVERWRKIDGGQRLEVAFTIEDPVAFTQPWTAKRYFDWSPNLRQMEYVCTENNRNAPDDQGFTGVIAPGGSLR